MNYRNNLQSLINYFLPGWESGRKLHLNPDEQRQKLRTNCVLLRQPVSRALRRTLTRRKEIIMLGFPTGDSQKPPPTIHKMASLPATPHPSVNSSYGEEEDWEDPERPSDGEPLLGNDQPTAGLPLAVRHSPKDAYCLVYVSFFLMGIGSLLPWNLFITARHYWLYKLSNHTAGREARSDLIDYFESYLSIASTVPSVLCLILNFLLVNRVSPRTRVLSSLGVILLLFILTTVLVKVDVSEHQQAFFAGTLATVAVVSGASNLFTGSMFGISGLFPMRISQALISGQAMGGTLTAVAAILDLAATEEVTASALAYFLTADVFIVICIVTYLLLPRLEYARHYISLAKCSGPCPSPASSSSSSVSVPPLLPILRKVWMLGLCVFYVFSVSIMVFPALSSGIQSVDKDSGSPWTNTYFVPLSSFLLYQTADFCGRQVTAWLQAPGPTSRVLPVLVLCRTLMLPLFMFCNYQPRDHLHTVLFDNDLYPIAFNCLLGLSNGYLGTLPMIYGPKVVPRELAEATGVVMSFFLTLGLAVGSACSVLIVHAI